MQAKYLTTLSYPHKKHVKHLRTCTDVAVGASGAGLVIVGWRGRGVKGQEEEERGRQEDLPGALHPGARGQERPAQLSDADVGAAKSVSVSPSLPSSDAHTRPARTYARFSKYKVTRHTQTLTNPLFPTAEPRERVTEAWLWAEPPGDPAVRFL